MSRLQSGEGRFRWLHARRGGDPPTCWRRRRRVLGDMAWVVTREQMLDEQLVRPDGRRTDVAARLGDVALVAHQPVSF